MATPSPARRKGGGHKRNSSLQWIVDALFSPADKEEKEVLKPFNPEEITKQERISRMLHNPSLRKGIPETGTIFEHFLLWRYPSPSSLDSEPTVLYHFPPDRPITIPGLVDFCFPHGWTRWLNTLKRTSSSGVLESVVLQGGASNSFAFMLTTEDGALYGAVVHSQVDDVIAHHQQQYPPGSESGKMMALLEPVPPSVPLCLCFLSRFPFFQMHFEVLDSIVGVAAQYFSPALAITRKEALGAGLGGSSTPGSPKPSLLHQSLDFNTVPRKSAPGSSTAASEKPAAPIGRSPLASAGLLAGRSSSSQAILPAASAAVSIVVSADSSVEEGATSPASATSPPPQVTTPPAQEADPQQQQQQQQQQKKPQQTPASKSREELRFSADDIESPPVSASVSSTIQISVVPPPSATVTATPAASTASSTTTTADTAASASSAADPAARTSLSMSGGDANDSVHIISPPMSPRDSTSPPQTAGGAPGSLGVPQPAAPFRAASAPVLINPLPGISAAVSPPAATSTVPTIGEILSSSPLTSTPTDDHASSNPNTLSPPGPKEKETSPITKILKAYCKLPLAERGKSMHLFVPHSSLAIKFTRPAKTAGARDNEEEKLMAEYGLAAMIGSMSRKAVMFLLSAVLLEKKVAVFSQSPRLVSSIILSVIPLIRPFTYQCSMIPLLPSKLQNFLDAPTPFLVGLVSMPAREDLPQDVMVINVETDSVLGAKYGDLPNLPNFEELDKKIRALERQFKKLTSSDRSPAILGNAMSSPLPGGRSGSLSASAPPQALQDQSTCLEQIASTMQEHLAARFANLRKHCIRDLTDKQKPITVFLKESFMEEVAEDDEAFYSQFFETQTWLNYVDGVLRDADTADQQKTAQQSSS